MTDVSWQTLDTVYQSSYLESLRVHWGPQRAATFLRYAFSKSLLQELAQADAVERHRAREKESILELVWPCQSIQLFLVLPSRNGRGKRWLSLQSAMKCTSNGFTQLGSRVQHWLTNGSESCWLFQVHLYSNTGWARQQLFYDVQQSKGYVDKERENHRADIKDYRRKHDQLLVSENLCRFLCLEMPIVKLKMNWTKCGPSLWIFIPHVAYANVWFKYVETWNFACMRCNRFERAGAKGAKRRRRRTLS